MTDQTPAARWEKPQGKNPPLVMDKRFEVVGRGVGLVIGCATFPTWNGYPGLFASLVTGNAVIVKPGPTANLPLAITVKVAREVLGYAVDVCRGPRQSPSLSLGVSPRGATALLATARAWAWLSGRGYVTPDDIKALAHPTLRHRVQLRAEAELEGVTAESVLDTVLASVPVPR